MNKYKKFSIGISATIALIMSVLITSCTDSSTSSPTALTGNSTKEAAGEQYQWRWCHKCQGLFYGPFVNSSNCPAGGTHSDSPSGNYMLPFDFGNSIPEIQSGWSYCNKCEGIFWGPLQRSSVCPSGGQHNLGTTSYSLPMTNENFSRMQEGWRYCWKCQGLFYGPNQSISKCPSYGITHDGSRSGTYFLPHSQIIGGP